MSADRLPSVAMYWYTEMKTTKEDNQRGVLIEQKKTW